MSEPTLEKEIPCPSDAPLASLALTALAVAGLTACGSDTPAEFDNRPAAPADATVAPAVDDDGDKGATPTDDKTRPADDTPPVPVDTTPVGPEDALHTITYDLPGADERAEATVTVGLHSLRQEGEVLALELSFTPHFRGDGEYSIYEMHDRNSITTVLNDRQNLKQYTVLGSGGGSRGWQTDTGPLNPAAKSGQTLMYWAYFAAPEDDIDTISVGVGQVEFTDVVIER